MKGRLFAFASVLCVACLIASGAFADKPEKKVKPDGPKTEWIAFEGDFAGGEFVEGCCPNAGPFPAYTMTLSGVFGEGAGTHLGQLFINFVGTKRNQEYKVQFWNSAIFVEIVGGEIDYDKKSKILKVRFTNEECKVTDANGESEVYVTFELTRTPM